VDDVTRELAKLRVIPVVVLERASDALALGAALKAGGLPCAEVTFRTAAAEQALQILADDSDLLVGAGTVLEPDQVDRALAAGARFIVTPGFSRRVAERCQTRGVPLYPGVVTPTEIQMALEIGIDVVKFFPAEPSGGAETLKALAGPFPMLRFIPTGGVNPSNLHTYLALTSVLAVGGSWMVAPRLIASADFTQITELTRETVQLCEAADLTT
jgi:2-dehydro-3-deoxyphosphogluconate aldolase / (4S)-4-hydroxy-2-oxoglutarate aldolase